jgi:hypothetical protein
LPPWSGSLRAPRVMEEGALEVLETGVVVVEETEEETAVYDCQSSLQGSAGTGKLTSVGYLYQLVLGSPMHSPTVTAL